MEENILFISGRPRTGKSTLVKEIINEFSSRKISGIITPEIREGRRRKGFLIKDLNSGEEEILASKEIKSRYRVGRYGVNIRGIEKIVGKFLESFGEAEICVIDELGTMELQSHKFREMIKKVLESNKPCLITLHRNLVQKYKNQGKVFWLKRENFEEVKRKVKEKLLECKEHRI